jgi:hypothetical protein
MYEYSTEHSLPTIYQLQKHSPIFRYTAFIFWVITHATLLKISLLVRTRSGPRDHFSQCPSRIIATAFIDINSINEFFDLQYMSYTVCLEPRMITSHQPCRGYK